MPPTILTPRRRSALAVAMSLILLAVFLAAAPPVRVRAATAGARPDAISWHAYTCDTDEDTDDCLNENGIEAWPARFTAARALMSQTLGEVLPIWITEWNFNPHDDLANDPKLQDQDFIREWTLKAIQTLADNGVAASMHYNVEDLLPLVTSAGAPTTQGQAFKEKYESLVSSPPPTGSSPRYSFEDGTLSGWSKTGNVSGYGVSTAAGGQDGTHSLKVTFFSSGSGDFPYLHDGSWVRLAFTPSGYSGAATQIGVQFNESPANTGSTVYVDSVTWG